MDPYIDGTYCAACYGRLIWSFQGTLKLQSDSEVSPIRHHENVKRLLSPLHPAFNVQVVYNIWTNRLQNLYIHYTVIVIRHWVQLSIDLQWSVVVCQANCFQWNHRTLQLYQGPYSHPVSPCSWTLRSSARKWPGLKEKKTVSVRADLDMVAYLPNGLLFCIVCWQQQLQISDSLTDPFFNPVLHNVHLATTRWQDLFQSNGPPPEPENWQKHWLKSCTKGYGTLV